MQCRRILIVEDDAAIAAMLLELLEAEGYEVEHARDGEAGLEALLAAPPDLLLLDVMMPRLDGPGVLRRARAAGLRLPVVLMSAGRSLDLGGLEFSAFVAKPFDVDHLLALVARLLGPVQQTG